MASFNRDDYTYLFDLGNELYNVKITKTRRREIAVTLMAMSEAVLGQQTGWPSIEKKHRKFNAYWLHSLDK